MGWEARLASVGNNYWNPQPTPGSSRSPPLGSSPWSGAAGRPDAAQFPPAHGSVTPPALKEPGLVSILDIETIGASANHASVATFAAPQGCGSTSSRILAHRPLALAPRARGRCAGAVWDLMRIRYTQVVSAPGLWRSSVSGSRVRQVAQFSRMTVARIVGVLPGLKPNGQRIAMVTEGGTVHLLDLPSSTFTWPPPRRRARRKDGKGGAARRAPLLRCRSPQTP